MTKKQEHQFNHMLATLKKISKDYQTPSQLQRGSNKNWGLNYEEALEMAYENIQREAHFASKGVKFLQLSS